MVKWCNICFSVYFIHRTFFDVMLGSYLWLHVEYNSTYETIEKISCTNHLQLISSCKLKSKYEVFFNNVGRSRLVGV
jgi:hypothetical protein